MQKQKLTLYLALSVLVWPLVIFSNETAVGRTVITRSAFSDSVIFSKGITLYITQATPKKILDTLRVIFPRQLFYGEDVAEIPGKTDLRVENATLVEIIELLAKKIPITHIIAGNYIVLHKKEYPAIRVKIAVRDENDQAIPYAKIAIKDTDRFLVTDSSGRTEINQVTTFNVLVTTCAGKDTVETPLAADSCSLTIVVHNKPKILKQVCVRTFFNGYDHIPTEIATGSFKKTNMINYQLLGNSFNVIGRFQDISIPTQMDQSDPLTGPVPLSFRGINSPFGNQKAIVVVDDFRQFNSTNFINPFDIGASNFLRDAAAGTLFGSWSANGALVLLTQEGLKKGKEINFLARTTVGQAPDLSAQSGLTAGDLIDFQQNMYNQYGSSSLPYHSPVRNILDKVKHGELTSLQAGDTFSLWSKNNLKRQIRNELLRPGVAQQYAINFRGGAGNIRYYASFGSDDNKMSEKGDRMQRQTFMGKTSFDNDTFLIKVNFSLANIKTTNNFVPVPTNISYWNLRDKNGQPQDMPYAMSPEVINAAGQPYFFPWGYNPLREQQLSNNWTNERYFAVNGKVGYTFLKKIQATFAYQQAYALYDHQIISVPGTFFTNNLLNTYRTLDSYGQPVWNIPIGSIGDQYTVHANTSQWRAQLKYTHTWGKFDFYALGGFERINHEMKFNARRDYAKDSDYPQSGINYKDEIELSVPAGQKDKIPNIDQHKDSAERYLNSYVNAYCTLNKKYTISGILRTDFSNRFSTELNNRGVRLWSASASWDISREQFFTIKFIDQLKWRVSYGLNGNIDYSILPARALQSINNQGLLTSLIRPEGPNLGYEKVYQFNTGFDFRLLHDLLTGSLDFFVKRNTQLINYAVTNSISGNEALIDNSGSLRASGIDLNLETTAIKISGDLTCSATLNLSYNKNKVTTNGNNVFPKTAAEYTDPLTASPRAGYPAAAVFAFKTAMLNGVNGNPKGYLHGEPSENYSSLVNATDGSTIYYVGPSAPTTMANFLPKCKYRSVTLALLFSGRFGYYERLSPLDYPGLVQQMNDGTPAYYKRWRNPGDELHTKIPSFQYPFDSYRETFSKGIDAYVFRADNIRLQMIQLSYQMNLKKFPKLPVKDLQLLFSVNNIGFIYRATPRAGDPDALNNTYTIPPSCTFTLMTTF